MKYLQVQCKKMLRLLPIIWTIHTFLILSLGLIAFVIGHSFQSNKADTSKVGVGIVGDIESNYINFGINLLNTMDSSKAFVRFEHLSEKAAKENLKSGAIIGYFYISKDFVEGLSKGENRPIQYVSSKNSGGLMYVLGKEVASVLTEVLVHSELAVYAMENYYLDHPNMGDVYQANKDLNKKLIFGVFDRKNIYDVNEIDSFQKVNVTDYYIGGMIVFYLLLSGAGMSVMFTQKDRELLKLLYARNINSFLQILCEYSILILMNLLGIAWILGIIFFAQEFFLSDGMFLHYPIQDFLWSIIWVVIMICAIQLLMFELVKDIVPTMLIQFIFGLSISFLSGILYPLSFFPKSMQDIAAYLPSRQGMLFLFQGMGYPVQQSLLNLSAVSLIAFMLAVYLRFRWIKR